MNKQELRSGYQPTVDKPIGTPPSGDSSVQMDNEDRNKPQFNCEGKLVWSPRMQWLFIHVNEATRVMALKDGAHNANPDEWCPSGNDDVARYQTALDNFADAICEVEIERDHWKAHAEAADINFTFLAKLLVRLMR